MLSVLQYSDNSLHVVKDTEDKFPKLLFHNDESYGYGTMVQPNDDSKAVYFKNAWLHS